ncbi:MAG: GntR family transcriptional regulator [Rhodobacteraceae bacterium]|nr:GntR family transcriptional regulator [Paracoccaceae bacterium]
MSGPVFDIKSLISEEAQVPPRRNLSTEAADALRDLILLEKLAPGTPVPERDVAAGLGISRTPLKEALRILENEGLIEYGPTRRPRVANPSIEELSQYISVLGALEALAGETACKLATDEEIIAIGAINSRLLGLPRAVTDLEFFRLDMEFHGAIVTAARNAPLGQTHRQYNARLWRARFMSSRQSDRRANTLAEHCAIVEALSARDSRRTANALRNHLKSTIRNISRICESSESQDSVST